MWNFLTKRLANDVVYHNDLQYENLVLGICMRWSDIMSINTLWNFYVPFEYLAITYMTEIADHQ